MIPQPINYLLIRTIFWYLLWTLARCLSHRVDSAARIIAVSGTLWSASCTVACFCWLLFAVCTSHSCYRKHTRQALSTWLSDSCRQYWWGCTFAVQFGALVTKLVRSFPDNASGSQGCKHQGNVALTLVWSVCPRWQQHRLHTGNRTTAPRLL